MKSDFRHQLLIVGTRDPKEYWTIEELAIDRKSSSWECAGDDQFDSLRLNHFAGFGRIYEGLATATAIHRYYEIPSNWWEPTHCSRAQCTHSNALLSKFLLQFFRVPRENRSNRIDWPYCQSQMRQSPRLVERTAAKEFDDHYVNWRSTAPLTMIYSPYVQHSATLTIPSIPSNRLLFDNTVFCTDSFCFKCYV